MTLVRLMGSHGPHLFEVLKLLLMVVLLHESESDIAEAVT
jgi:hypothetical protein